MSTSSRNLVSGRPDGRQLNSLAHLRALYQIRTPELCYPGKEDAAAWRGKVIKRLEQLMDFPLNPTTPPRLMTEEQRDGYRLQKWEFYPDELSVMPFLMLVPDGASSASPAPLVLCFSGSDHTKEMLAGEPNLPGVDVQNRSPENNAMARHYARRGMIAVAVDHPAIGELRDEAEGPWSRQDISWHLMWMGSSYEAYSVALKRALLGVLKGRPEIDPTRIATSGHSLGAKPALIVGLLEPDVGAVVYNDFIAPWSERQVVTGMKHPGFWHLVPGVIRAFDYPDLMKALAPKPLLITEGGRTEVLEAIGKCYAEQHASGAYQYFYYPEFEKAEDRPFDHTPLPENIDRATYNLYVNVNAEEHWFKPDLAVPWLAAIFKLPSAS